MKKETKKGNHLPCLRHCSKVTNGMFSEDVRGFFISVNIVQSVDTIFVIFLNCRKTNKKN